MTDIVQQLKELKEELRAIKEMINCRDEFVLLDVKQAAAFLCVSTSTMHKISANRLIPHYKPEGKVYFLKEDLMDYFKKGRVSSISELTEDQFNLLKKRQDGVKAN